MASLKELVGKVAPAIGTALGGPLGGAATAILAELFAVEPTEAAVTAAVNSSDPEVVKANLARAEAAFKAAAEESITVRSQIDAYVEMMRLDYQRGAFHGWWRPFAGWAATLCTAGMVALNLYMASKGDYQLLNMATQQLMVCGPLMAMAGILSYNKSQERVATANGAGALGDMIRGALGRR